jgi:Leucine-rich repeat (LRR) protein
MNLNPNYIKANLDEIGIKEAETILKELIDNSNDDKLRENALKLFGELDDCKGKNFNYYEQLFLSDENIEVSVIAGNIIKNKYVHGHYKKVMNLFKFTLHKITSLQKKLLALEILNELDTKGTRKIIGEFLKDSIKKLYKNKVQEFPKDLSNINYNIAIPPTLIKICENIIVGEYYTNTCGYNISMRNGLIILLSCEGANLSKIDDIVGLDKITGLKHLLLQRNELKRIEGLDKLTGLKVLNLSRNKINKIENLTNLTKLEELILSHNEVTKIENVDCLMNLKSLVLDNNKIFEIENIEKLSNLEILNLNHNRVSEIKNLNSLRKLKDLHLSSNKIEKITGLSKLNNLIFLHLNDNKINQIEGLVKLERLKGLYMTSNRITRINGLENLRDLNKLQLSNNQISKIEGLTDLKLQEVYLDNNRIEKLEGLDTLDNLVILFLKNNKISEYEGVNHLKSLNFVFLNENPLTQESWERYSKKFKF